MASNILSSGSFTTTNMKPASDEQIDALWGDNIADNTGYVYYRVQPGPCFTTRGETSAHSGTFYFKKEPAYATMTGTIVGTFDSGGSGEAISVRVDGTIVFNHSLTAGTAFKASFATSVSHLTNNSYYEVSYQWAASSSTRRMNVTTFNTP